MIVQANSYRIPAADKSVHCIVTSPPYWGLRDYGLEPLVWGGAADCQHKWGSSLVLDTRGVQLGKYISPDARGCSNGQFCRHCHAWRGSFGLEPTIDLFVQHMVEIGRELWRVLRDDGTLWLNIGDSFATGSNGRSAADTKTLGNDDRTFRDKPFSTVGNGLKAKDMVMVPARVALALQADGWWLRQDIIWHKPNPMPESVSDRPTTAHEHVFLLTKAERYFYDSDAVREKKDELTRRAASFRDGGVYTNNRSFNNRNGKDKKTHGDKELESGRNLRSVWTIATEPYPAAHYATFPTRLVEPCIKAGTSQRGCCPACGAGWERVVEKESSFPTQNRNGHPARYGDTPTKSAKGFSMPSIQTSTTTTGWRPTCSCIRDRCPDEALTNADWLSLIDEVAADLAPVPAIVLDPFCGSGTTGAVARELGRRFIGLDLSPVYLAKNALPRAEKKTSQAALAELPLFESIK